MADFEVHLDDAAIYDLLDGPDSPVVRLLEEISEIGAKQARATVPIRRAAGGRFVGRGLRSTSYPSGYTYRSIRTNVHWYNGLVYGGIAAVEDPTVFLEAPAEQMHHKYPFMSTAFDDVYL